jgi:hypothetical protein
MRFYTTDDVTKNLAVAVCALLLIGTAVDFLGAEDAETAQEPATLQLTGIGPQAIQLLSKE